MTKNKTEKAKLICQPLVILSCQESYKRLTKLEYLVLLIIQNFGDIQLYKAETKEYYWPDMSECVSNYLKTQKFDEVLEVVMEELFRKKLLKSRRKPEGSYIKLKLNEVEITDAFDGSVFYDRFTLSHRYYQLLPDTDAIRIRPVAEKSLPAGEVCRKFRGRQCLPCNADELLAKFKAYIAKTYTDHEDDILIDIQVFPQMVPYEEEASPDQAQSDKKIELPYCLE